MNVLVLLAGGTGSRTGLSQPKQFLKIHGKTLIEWCLERFLETNHFQHVVIVCSNEHVDWMHCVLGNYKISYHITKSGQERANSVINGLIACPEGTQYVAIHDSARANVSTQLIEAVLKKSIDYQCGAIPGFVGSDSIKLVDEDQKIIQTLNRNRVFKVQTPQIFPFQQILESYREGLSKNYKGTDCSSYYEQLYDVVVVNGDESNIKLTFQDDIEHLRTLLQQ